MPLIPQISGAIFPFMVGLALTSCATTNHELDLANTTGTHVLTVSSHLRNFKATQERVAEAEGNRLASFLKDLVRDESWLQEQLAARKDAAPSSRVVFGYQKLKKLADLMATNAGRAEKETSELKMQITKGQMNLEIPKDELRTVSEKLAVLGKDESLEDRVKFLIGFGKEVKDAMEKIEKDRKAALAEMEKK